MNSFPYFSFSKKQHTDAGMAFVLILLLAGYFTGNHGWYKAAISALFVAMAFPILFYPFSAFWFNLTEVLGNVMSRVILTVIYLVLVIPAGLIRRVSGKDVLQLKDFRKGRQSVFITRNTRFTKEDIKHPY